ncbi:MAG: putative Tau-tubulin kinase [Streblomastix strix]|uniref:non-specific serine/threonine protein kinase n=1 Tax=Streblomastix strix TaxID=222440 RepID=A0A5J4WWG3_9EUKA|nr:MAG: putative Tau-tubulin kinase [Streblomastix strix]
MTSPITASVPLQIGDVIKDRYTLLKQIGAGTYGAIYAALYRGNMVTRLVAIKFEKVTQKYSLQYNEVALMKLLAGSSHFAKFYRCGTHEGFKFVCMELLGPSLIQLVNRKRPYQLNLFQLLKFGVQAIKCLQELHKAGFVHRDVKPENFVIGNTKKTAGTIYLIDFGLCKRLPVVDGKIVKPTNKGSFRGTLRYASPNGHKLLELGRHDDLISLLYMMVEYYTGKLPWSNTEDINEILHLKQQSIGGRLFSKMPLQFQEFENHIFQLDFVDEPDYKKLIGLMFLVAYNSKLDLNNWPFEWEEELNQQREIVRHRLNSGLNESLDLNVQYDDNQITAIITTHSETQANSVLKINCATLLIEVQKKIITEILITIKLRLQIIDFIEG